MKFGFLDNVLENMQIPQNKRLVLLFLDQDIRSLHELEAEVNLDFEKYKNKNIKMDKEQ